MVKLTEKNKEKFRVCRSRAQSESESEEEKRKVFESVISPKSQENAESLRHRERKTLRKKDSYRERRREKREHTYLNRRK